MFYPRVDCSPFLRALCLQRRNPCRPRVIFSLVGGFGIITSARIRTSANQTLTSEHIDTTIEDFPDIYTGILADSCIDIEL